MAQIPLITRSEIQTYRDISNAIEDNRLNAMIIEAQFNDVRPLLGDEMWYNFTSSLPDGDKYDLLLNGGVYKYRGNDVEYQGLKPIIAYYTLARIYQHHSTHINQYGIEQRFGESGNTNDQSANSQLKRDARAIALSFVDGLEKYLGENSSTYPLYVYSEKIKRNSFNFTKV